MKAFKNSILVLGVLLLIACSQEQKPSKIPTIDVTKSYPQKEIVLQDIADVEYIPLETRDNVLIDNLFTVGYLSKDTIMIANKRKGDVFIFNGKGKFLHSLNHRGQGAGEYVNILRFIYNVTTQEIFVYTSHRGKRAILVYSLHGKFKRKFSIATDMLSPLRDFDEKYLLGYEKAKSNIIIETKEQNPTPLFLISKETGEVDTIQKFRVANRKSADIVKKENGIFNIRGFATTNISKSQNGFVIDDLFADTIYSFHKDKKLEPILIKKPKINEMGDIPTIVSLRKVTEKYFFIYTELYKFQKQNNRERTFLCVDRENNEIVNYILRNRDINDKDFEIKPYTMFFSVSDVLELLENGKLNGKLKEIAKNLKEDDNPILMKVTFKN